MMSGQRPPPPPEHRPGGMAPPPHPDFLPRGGPMPGPGQYHQPLQPMQSPIRNSTRFRNVSRRMPLDEDACRKKLTTYKAFTIRKAIPNSPSQKSTWALANVTEEAWGQEDIIKQLKRLNSANVSVTDKKESLKPNMQMQVNELLDELYNEDRWDPHFETSLAQLDSKIHTLRSGIKETATLTVYAKRAPKPDAPVIGLYEARERQKMEQMRPPPPPPPPPTPPPPPPPPIPSGGQGGAGFIDLGSKDKDKDKDKKSQAKGHGGKYPKKKKSYNSSTSSDFTGSESDSGSDYTTTASSWSSKSGRRQKKYNKGGRRQSHDRLREHQKFVSAPMPPDYERRESFGGGPRPSYIPPIPPEVPLVNPMLNLNIEAAYHRGKLDADQERFDLERALERTSRIHAPPEGPQTMVAFGGHLERDNIPEPRRLGPRLVPDTRYTDELRRQDELIRDEARREEDIRRDELRREDLRREDLRREETRRRELDLDNLRRTDIGRENLRQRELDQNEYVNRHRSSTPRIYNANPNPFSERRRSPRGYSPSLESRGW